MQFKNIGNLLSAGKDFNKLSKVIKEIGSLDKAVDALKLTSGLSDDLKVGVLVNGLEKVNAGMARTALGIKSVGDTSITASSGLSKLGSAFKGALTTFIKSPVGIATAIAAVTAGLVALFEYIDVTADESREAMLSMQSDYDSTKSEIESLNSELETTQDRIDELNAKEHLSLVEQEELSNLQAQNDALLRTIELEEARLKLQAQRLAQEAEENYKEWTTRDDAFGNTIAENGYDKDKVNSYKRIHQQQASGRIDNIKYNATHFLNRAFADGDGSIKLKLEDINLETAKDDINQLIGTYEALKEEMDAVTEAKDGLTSANMSEDDIKQVEALDTYYDGLNEKLLETHGYMDEYTTVMTEIQTAYDNAMAQGIELSNDQKAQYQEAQAFLTEYMKLYVGASKIEGNINTIFSKARFIELKDGLVEAGKSGRDALESVIASTPGLTNELENAGVSAQQLADYIMAIADPNTLKLDEVKRYLRETFTEDDYEISLKAGKNADAVWNEFIEGKTDEELEIFYRYTNKNEIDFSDFSLEDLEATYTVAVKGADEVEEVKKTFSSIMSDDSEDAFSKKVDVFQENISSLDSALESLKNGEDVNMTDLAQEFAELNVPAENLKQAIENLKIDKINDFVSEWKLAFSELTGDEAKSAQLFLDNLIGSLDMTNMDLSNYRSIARNMLAQNATGATSVYSLMPTWDKLFSEYGNTIEGQEAIIKLSANPENAYKDFDTLKTLIESSIVEIQLTDAEKNVLELQNQMSILQAHAQGVQDSLSLKEAKGVKPLVSDYHDLVQNSKAQIWNLKKQNVELQKQTIGLKTTDSKYQEIQNQINSNVSAINQARISQIEWNEAASRLNYEPGEGLTAYNKAKSTRNAGDNYVDMMSGLKEAKELYDKGLIGTDDFQEYARMISPSGAIDPANFLENYGKVSEWFTEGTDGVKTFLNELDTKGLAEFNEETQQWTWNIEDMAKAANEMGVSEEVMTAMFGRLQDYGFDNNYVSSVADGVQRLSDLYADLAREQALLEEMESSPDRYTEEQRQDKRDLIESITSNITATGESMGYVAENAGKAANAQIESAKSAIETLAEQREKILDSNEFGENTEAVARELENQILGLAEENNLQLDAEFNVLGKEDVAEATDALRTLRENGEIDIDLNFDKSEMSSDELQAKIDELTEAGASIDVTTEGGQEALDEINTIISSLETEKTLKLALEKGSTVEELLALEDDDLVNTLQIDDSQIDEVRQSLRELSEETQIPVTVQIADEQFNQLVNDEKAVTVDSSSADEAREKLDKINQTDLDNKSFYISSNLSSVESYLASVKRYLELLDGKTSTIKINKVTTEMATKSMGTFSHGTLAPAYVSGTAYNVINTRPAYVNGRKVSLDHDETALVNERGTEGLIRQGVLYEIPGGMHYQSLKKGDMILSVEQMKQLSLTGRASGKARAYADGTVGNIPLMSAYSGSSIGGGGFQGGAAGSAYVASTYAGNTSAIQGLTQVTKKNTDATDKQREAYNKFVEGIQDWIKVWKQREEESRDLNLARSENATGYQEKNKYVSNAQIDLTELIAANETGLSKYKTQANKVKKKAIEKKLVTKSEADDIVKKIENGGINIEDYDEDARTFIDQYSEWYDKAMECRQAIQDLNLEQKELAQQKFDNVVTEFDNIIGRIEHAANLINASMDESELRGHLTSTKYYDALIANTSSSIAEMEKKRAEMIASLESSMKSGVIKEKSVEWYEMQSQIDEVTESIAEANNEMLEYANSSREALWAIEDMKHEYVSRLTSEADFFTDLMSNDKMFDDKGNITAQGTATKGLAAMNYNTALSESQRYADEWQAVQAEIEKKNAGEDYDINLVNRANDIRDSWQNAASSVESYRQQLKDLEEEKIRAQLDALKKLSDSYMDVLRSQKDAFDYQNEMSDLTDQRDTLKQRVIAYSSDTSEEGKLKRRQAENDLAEIEKQITETQYDKYISDQEELLNNVYTQTEEFLQQRLDNIDQLVSDAIADANANAANIRETLETEANNVAYNMSGELQQIWSSEESVLSTFDENFTAQSSAILTVLGDIRSGIDVMAGISDRKAEEELGEDLGGTPNNQPTGNQGGVAPSDTASTDGGKDGGGSKEDDEIVKIIKSGNDDKSYIKKQRKAKKHSKLWTYIVDEYGHVPTYEIYRKLGKKLGVKPKNDYKDGADTDALLKALKAKGYAKGTDYIDKDRWALTQENGAEIIALPDGSIITPLMKGTGVVNNAKTEKLLSLADNHDAVMSIINSTNELNMTKQATQVKELVNSMMGLAAGIQHSNGEAINYNGTTININLPNVTNKEEFMRWLQNDPKVQKTMQNAVLSEVMGKGKLSSRKY